MRARVRARSADGVVHHDEVLGHGQDPMRLLAAAGWDATWVSADRVETADGTSEVVLDYTVKPGETTHPYQRLSTYAVVFARVAEVECLLLTSFSAPGSTLWGLPGGGVDHGEDPLAAVHREVWEETGQRIEEVVAHAVDTDHWVGRAPSGRFEDYHPVRLIYTARCPQPSEPVVHDVGGSTASARWIPVATWESGPPVQAWGAAVLRDVLRPGPKARR